MKRFLALLCFLFVVLLPMAAMATGEITDYVGPNVGIWASLVVVSVAIALDTILGILLGIKDKTFDVALLPKFLLTGVLPFIGSLLVMAVLAHYIAAPFAGMFYAAVATVVAKYIGDIWEKLRLLFGASLVTPEEMSS